MRNATGDQAVGSLTPVPLPPPPPPHTPSAALKAVIEECKPGAKIADICVKGDAVVEE